mmetsp:Transcript_2723/g.5806  ORF Transcript_2723/g.5806 Transcript_2723/m.5806 type:complete len:377 (-) Transcript_2723:4295-5425(-)
MLNLEKITLLVATIGSVHACSHIELAYGQDGHLVGRTLEIGGIPEDQWEVHIVPRNYTFPTRLFATPEDPTFVSQYGMVGTLRKQKPSGGDIFELHAMVDGINSQGLSVSANTHRGAVYQANGTGMVLHAGAVVPYLLGNFANVSQLRNAIKNKEFSVLPGPPRAFGAFNLHFGVADKTGDSIVIEYLNGEPVVHSNTVGIMTNDPDYEWHLRNLNQYSNISPVNPSRAGDIGHTNTSIGPVPQTVGHGFNLVGLPGDAGPPARFVKSFFYRELAVYNNGRPANEQDAIVTMSALLDSIRIPMGVVPRITGNDRDDYTVWNCIKISNPPRYIFRSYRQMQWESIDLTKLDGFFKNGTAPKTLPVSDTNLKILDVTP